MTDRRDRNARVVEEFRANGGRVGPPFENVPILLLHHRGARTGTARVNPLAYLADGDRYVVIASKGGAPTNPDWYHNLLANPDVTIEVGTETLPVRAVVVTGDERDELYRRQAERLPAFGQYAQRTRRVIPVVALAPVEG
jgi:deazaflavin-dependent oxidoreductase (nitroreductase family)